MTFLTLFFSCSDVERSIDLRTTLTDRGTYSVSYTLSPDPIPLSEDFSLGITIENIDGVLLFEDISVEATADMPSHGHGMPQEPVVAQDDSEFTASGFFFQMSGDWEILIYVSEALEDETTNIEQAVFEIACCQ